MKAVVTGGAGFVGSNLVRRLVALGHAVTVLDGMIEGSGANPANLADVEGGLIECLHVDLADAVGWHKAVAGADSIFHLAAQTGHEASMREPLEDLKANAVATLRLLAAVREVAPQAAMVFTSTRQVYGRPQVLPVSEAHPLAPPDINAVHKMAAEEYLRIAGRVDGRASVVLRLTNTYGPGMRVRDARQSFVGYWVRLALEGQDIPVYGDGEQVRDLTYVDDVVDALIDALPIAATSSPRFNLGGDVASLLAIAQQIIAAAGAGSYRLVPFPEERQRIDIGSFRADDSAFRTASGWAPRVSWREGIRRTVEYYRSRRKAYW